MIIKDFSFGNIRSFKDVNSLTMVASELKEENEGAIINDVNGQNILKVKAIYGANASGKSNVFKAFISFLRIIDESFKDNAVLELIDNYKYSIETIEEPTYFQIIFNDAEVDYRYGFIADGEKVYSEWLFRKVQSERKIFIREEDKLDYSKTYFKEANVVKEILEHNVLVLTLAERLRNSYVKEVFQALRKISILEGLKSEKRLVRATELVSENSAFKKYLQQFLTLSDIRISTIGTIKIPEKFLSQELSNDEKEKASNKEYLVAEHDVYDGKQKKVGKSGRNFLEESEGTIKMLELAPDFIQVLSEGGLLLIDEFDARFHPLISKKIVELFNSEKNTKNAQLIFITHDTNLLDSSLLRRDQIDFVEKDQYGASHLYSLSEIKGIRPEHNYEKDYIKGKYGAIPFLGDFSSLIDNQIKDAEEK